jgi:hypothetical protein
MVKVKLKNVDYKDWDRSERKPPSRLTVSIPSQVIGDAMAEIDAILTAIEDKTGCEASTFTPIDL